MMIDMKEFKTVDVVVKDLLCQNSGAFTGLEKGLSAKEFAYKFHLSIGAKICNDYGLWDGNDALLKGCKVTHPDDASGVILQKLWQALRSQDNE